MPKLVIGGKNALIEVNTLHANMLCDDFAEDIPMRAMALRAPGQPLELESRAIPQPKPGELLLKVRACAVCRTDLHVIDGDLPPQRASIVPGHEIIGEVIALGEGVAGFKIGQRAGVGWLGRTCGHCAFCTHGEENLCDFAEFTGYQRDGGFADFVVADAAFSFPIPDFMAMRRRRRSCARVLSATGR